MITGIIIAVTGLLSILYAYIAYKKADLGLSEIKKEDLVSYYLELALHLIPFPFWAFAGGALLFLAGIITIIISMLI
ncbi:hypothetical protein [Thermosyntropha sp.]|uniref:hypothetical protein n=1 Tax=Thermosyntropha sp. TaxID=2740820 RepID=UPI0025F1F374|nr:hypothetical protein [Thermosyntropha sp.]MBO8158354.1 hypothetical protein [Thermosyntropha sp.]